jgi:hypothetical protein
MKLSLILAPLIAAKVPHELIMDTILAFESQQTDALEKRREADRNRQARVRQKEPVTLSHVTRSPSRSHAGVEDSSSKKDITGKKEKEESASASPSAPKRASRLPANWIIPEDWLNEAVAAGLSRQRALSEADRMKNWSLSAKNGAKLDWLAAWRNWFKDKAEQQPAIRSHSQAPPPPRVVHGVTAALARRYQRQEPHEQNPETGSDNPDAERIPGDERQLRLVAGHIRAAVGGGFDRSG